MADFVAGLAYGLLGLVGLVVGGRLLRLAARTHQLPELVFGLAAVTQSVTGIVFWVVPAALPQGLLWYGAAVALSAETVGIIFVCLGCWLIFRRGERWALATAVVLSLLAVAVTGIRLVVSEPAAATPQTPLGQEVDALAGQLLSNLAVAAAYGWLAIEALRYAVLMRRRLSLGLDPPIAVHQFALWGLACASIVAINLVVLATVMGLGVSVPQVPWIYGLVSLFGLVGALSLWFAFYPPHFYRVWVEDAAEARA